MAGRQKLVKVTFYLPVVDNDGKDLADLIHQVEDRCFDAFGTWTLVGHFRGVWRMEAGEKQMDTCAVYSVVVAPAQVPDVERILKWFKAWTTQEAIYVEVDHDVDVKLL